MSHPHVTYRPHEPKVTGVTGAPRLVLASALMLFVQLALIRWCGANLVHLSYFSNLILLASFLGIGLGFLRSSKPKDFGLYAPIALLVLVKFVTVFPARIEGSSKDLIFFTTVQPTGLPTWVTLPAVFLGVTASMMLLGEITGRAFRDFPALTAYRWDILGSILGTLAYTLLAFLHAPSWVWPSLTLLALVLLYGKRLPLASWVAMVLIVGLLVVESLSAGVSWSPYYKVQTKTYNKGTPQELTNVSVNGVPHQNVLDVNERLKTEPVYGRPYERAINNPLRNVLIVGAGTGSDVALALQQGAQHIDAVEIDPRLQQLGKQINPNHPYDNPRVTVHINDGRAFLSRTHNKYDLILFALPDSLTLVSGASQLRLESYLFTKQSIESAHAHLTEEGVFAMYNYYREDWLINRLAGTVANVFRSNPCLDTFTQAAALAAITVGRNPGNAVCAPNTTWDKTTILAQGGEVPAPATDNHPFVYLKTPTIPNLYLFVIALVIAISALSIRLVGGPIRNLKGYTDLFFMGTAFLLLETKSVTTFALLFGTTWVVNALVFTGVLLAVLAAIEVTRRFPALPRRAITAGIFISLLVAYLIPNSALLTFSLGPRALAAITLAFAPVFFANLLFTSRFQHAANPTAAFAANLFGAMIGGCLEYLSLLTGYHFLLLVVAGVYLCAVITGRTLDKQTIAA